MEACKVAQIKFGPCSTFVFITVDFTFAFIPHNRGGNHYKPSKEIQHYDILVSIYCHNAKKYMYFF